LIWLKRLLPFVILGATAFGYHLWDKSTAERRRAEQDRLAHLTARIWVATAEFRDNPERFLAYRDSLIAAAGLSHDAVFAFLDRYSDDPEALLPLSRQISDLVDSIYKVEDSLSREAKIRAHDSTLRSQGKPRSVGE
jgi:hypothetical protein